MIKCKTDRAVCKIVHTLGCFSHLLTLTLERSFRRAILNCCSLQLLMSSHCRADASSLLLWMGRDIDANTDWLMIGALGEPIHASS